MRKTVIFLLGFILIMGCNDHKSANEDVKKMDDKIRFIDQIEFRNMKDKINSIRMETKIKTIIENFGEPTYDNITLSKSINIDTGKRDFLYRVLVYVPEGHRKNHSWDDCVRISFFFDSDDKLFKIYSNIDEIENREK